jgi:hypothetical protein
MLIPQGVGCLMLPHPGGWLVHTVFHGFLLLVVAAAAVQTLNRVARAAVPVVWG